VLLNSIFPELEHDNMKLGQIKIVSPIMGGHSRIYDIGYLTKNYLPEIFSVTKKHNSELEIPNNLKDADFIDYVDLLCKRYEEIMSDKSDEYKNRFDKFGFEELLDAENNSEKILALKTILESMFVYYPNAETLKNALHSNNSNTRLQAQIF
jgi:hypothetical protein